MLVNSQVKICLLFKRKQQKNLLKKASRSGVLNLIKKWIVKVQKNKKLFYTKFR